MSHNFFVFPSLSLPHHYRTYLTLAPFLLNNPHPPFPQSASPKKTANASFGANGISNKLYGVLEVGVFFLKKKMISVSFLGAFTNNNIDVVLLLFLLLFLCLRYSLGTGFWGLTMEKIMKISNVEFLVWGIMTSRTVIFYI